MMYLQEAQTATDSVIDIERLQKPYRIQVNDLLSIRVKELDQQLMGMFNPIGEANPGQLVRKVCITTDL